MTLFPLPREFTTIAEPISDLNIYYSNQRKNENTQSFVEKEKAIVTTLGTVIEMDLFVQSIISHLFELKQTPSELHRQIAQMNS